MKKDEFEIALRLIVTDPSLLDELPPCINFNFPTLGGEFFWKDLANYNGWRIQQNKIFNNVRILDSSNYRRWWSPQRSTLTSALKKIINSNIENQHRKPSFEKME